MRRLAYNRAAAVAYAKKWAELRNPRYMNFDEMGGDCTNFASQCIYAGGNVMNYTKDTGWYYNSPTDRAAAWSGVEYLHNFLMNNKSVGPVARNAGGNDLQEGDLIFLSNGQRFYHTLVITGFSGETPLVCSHTVDSYMRRLNTYSYFAAQGVHIEHINSW